MRPKSTCLALFLLVSGLLSVHPALCQVASPVSGVAKQHSKSVVLIVTQDRQGRKLGTGSGFIVKPEGIIVTNYHIIKGANAASVRTSDGDMYDDAFVIDTDKRKDLAVLRVKALNLPISKLGDSDKIEVGQHVIAIGNPLGLTGSVSDGIVSAIRQAEGYKVIQTTAPISPGSSGGPLLNDSGEVIGVTFANLDGQNLNLAIPINYAKPIIQFGESNRPMTMAEFNSAEPGSVLPSRATDAASGTPGPREQSSDAAQLAELMSLKSKAANMDTNTRVSATHRIWAIGLASKHPEVKTQALELLGEPVGSASDHIRMPAVYAIAEIARSTEDIQVKIKALTMLREPLEAEQVPIRDVAIDAVNIITGSANRHDIALAAVKELGAPIQSGNNGVRIPAINAVVRAVEGSRNDAACNAALDLLVAPLNSSALIGGIEVRMMAVAAVEKVGLEASDTGTKARAVGLLRSYAGKGSWEPEAKKRAEEAASNVQGSIRER